MSFNSFLKYSLCICFLLLSLGIVAQEEDPLGTEVVNIVKPYTPSLSDAFKVKETPVLTDSSKVEKQPLQYQIFSVPVASTFTPAKGKATQVEKSKPLRLYDNYATLGFGNFTSVLGELFSSFELSRTDNATLFFRHNSSQGGIDEVVLDNAFYDTELSGSYTSRQRDQTYNLEAGLTHQVFNWYGLNQQFNNATPEAIAAIDPQQTYLGVNLGGSIQIEESFFKKASANIHYTTDAFSSSEVNLLLQPEFVFPLQSVDFHVKGDLDFLSGSFDRNYFSNDQINYGFLNVGVQPSIVYTNDDLSLALGAKIYGSFNTEASTSEFLLFPNIQASYRVVDEIFIAYGGVEGGLDQNSYRELLAVNPFVSPTLNLVPTNQLYNAYVGMKGKLSKSVGYNLRGSYGSDENRALFIQNPYKGMNPSFEGYELGNSFGITYDDINTLNLFGELKVEVSDSFQLGASANFYSYSTDQQQEAWNLPALEANLFSNFDITNEIYGGVSLFFVGERKDLLTINTPQVVTLESFLDANIHIGYRVNDRLSIFAKGSNLLGNNYERWLNYPVLGIQGLLGASYKFDWQ